MEGRALVAAAVRRFADAGTSLLIAEHDTDLLNSICGRIVGLEAGRAVADQPAGASASDHEPVVARRESRPSGPAGPRVITCEGVRYDYPDGTRALDGIDLQVRAGERVAIVGSNGSGKTTLVRTWNGLLRPTDGRVEVAGTSTAGRHVAALARSVGLTFQDPNHQVFAGTCRDEIAFGARNVGLARRELETAVDDALEAVGLADQAGTNPYDLGPSRRRLLAIASVLAMGTPIVVLDEPTMGLDAEERARVGCIVQALAAAGRTVVAISHDARFVGGSFERVVALERGRVIADGPPAA
jgi:energy-coupling factor transport system ATP-binding protein